MAKKGTSQTDLERRIVGSAAAGERVIDVMRLFPQILLREDSRVQAAYRSWLKRMPDEVPTLQRTSGASSWMTRLSSSRCSASSA